MDLASELARDAGNRLELLAARPDQPLGRSEVRQEGALADRPDAGKLIEQGARHRLVAAMAMARKAATAPNHPTEDVTCAVSASLRRQGVMVTAAAPVLTRWPIAPQQAFQHECAGG